MKAWTVDEMLAERPCKDYTRERLTKLWAGYEHRSLLDILDMPIPDDHKVWMGCRPDAFDRQREWIDGIRERVRLTFGYSISLS